MLQTKANILCHSRVGPRHYRLTLNASAIARRVQPGQFVELRVDEAWEPLLRRPFSIHRARKGVVEILYEVVGKATEVLSHKKAGQYLEVLGPLGNGFDLDGDNHAPLLVAGGMGVAPLIFLAERLAQKNKKTTVLLGARDRKDILCHKDFRDLGLDIKIATDNGSRGFQGRVTELLRRQLTTNNKLMPPPTIYACGPRPMLQEVARLSLLHNITAWISLEEHMACGIGACLGCVVNTQSGYQRVCKEGPVFEARQIIWEKRDSKGGH
jgi:dihydroorotate dehydrogenase electron transfer subunit